jgi:predicted membrane-bound spermidine synthase
MDNALDVNTAAVRDARGGFSERFTQVSLYVLVLIVAAIGLGYELALGATESFLLGDPIVQFALIVGLYMSSLGLGAFATERIQRSLDIRFLDATLATALVGGVSSPLLFVVFAQDGPFRLVLYVTTVLLGGLVGGQYPLLMRLLKNLERVSALIARAFAWDYAGALIGSIAFSLVLMPSLGLVRTTATFGLFQIIAGFAVHYVAYGSSRRVHWRWLVGGTIAVALALIWVMAGYVDAMTERAL